MGVLGAVSEALDMKEISNKSNVDSETHSNDVIKTCSILPYVEMSDFCGEYKPADISQIIEIINFFEGESISTDELQEGLRYFK